MTAPRRRRAPSPLGMPLTLSLVIVVGLATLGSFGATFNVLQTCTDLFGCSATECRPCLVAGAWAYRGWAIQGVLLLVGITLVVLARRGVRSHAVRWAGRLLGPVSIALLVATTSLAHASY